MEQADDTKSNLSLKLVLFVLAITVLIYAQVLRFPFLIFDDTPFIVQNPSAQHWSSALSSFLPGVLTDPFQNQQLKIANFYRPIVVVWLVLNYKIFGLHVAGWRAATLLMYGLGIWLFWRVAYKLTKDDFVAFAAALLFALHPLHVEGVAWLAGACVELLLCVFFFGGFLAYLKWRETAQAKWLVLCGVLVLCALLVKETGAALPLLIGVHALVFRSAGEPGEPQPFVPRLQLAAAVAAPVILYAALRMAAIHDAVASVVRHQWSEVFRSAPLFFVVYLEHALWPVRLANWYDIQVIPALNLRQFYLPLALCIAYAGLTVWALRRKPLAGFLLIWWVVPLLPAFVGMINFIDNEYMHDRFTFEALAGLCLLAALGLRRMPETKQSLFGFSAAGVGALAVLTISFGWLTNRLVNTWHSDFAMTSRAIEVSPTAIRPRVVMGSVIRKDHQAALALARETLKIAPDRWEAVFAYGTALANAGDLPGAVRVLLHGIQMAPSKTAFYLTLSDMLADAGHFDDACKVLESGLSKAEEPNLLQAELARVKAKALQSRPLAANIQ